MTSEAALAQLPAITLTDSDGMSRLTLAGDRASGLLHLSLDVGMHPTQTTIAVAPLLALIAHGFNIRINGGPELDPATYVAGTPEWRIHSSAAGQLDVTCVPAGMTPIVSFSPTGRLQVHPRTGALTVYFELILRVASGYTRRLMAEFVAADVVETLASQFGLTVVDQRNVLIRHTRDPLPAFEVFDDGTTELLIEDEGM